VCEISESLRLVEVIVGVGCFTWFESFTEYVREVMWGGGVGIVMERVSA
jgi:hypothetical protein